MKKYPLLLLCLSIVLLYDSSPVLAQGWDTAKSEDGIEVFVRMNNNSESREIKAEMLLNISPIEGVTLIKDAEKAPQWINRMEQFDILEEKGDSVWYTYGRLQIPWPLSDKDIVSKNTLIQTQEGYKIEIASKPGLIEQKPSVSRIKDSEGFWLFEETEAGKTLVTYQVFAASNSVLPEWLLNMVVVGSVFKTFEGMQEILEAEPSAKGND